MKLVMLVLLFCCNIWTLHRQERIKYPRYPYNKKEKEPGYWHDLTRNSIMEMYDLQKVNKPAKNVILFLGDGLSVATLTAARIYKGQQQGHSGEEQRLFLETFPYSAVIKTYCVDRQVPDSAATATAYLCGSKANFETLKVNGHVKSWDRDCDESEKHKVASIFDWAQQAGKATGFVTTSTVTDATPAAGYASISTRYWDYDAKLPDDVKGNCKDIARQLVENLPGRQLDVVMGGGRRAFYNASYIDPASNERGQRRDVSLVDEWLRQRKEEGYDDKSYAYTTTATELRSLETDKVQRLLGLFSYGNLAFEEERNYTTEPSLAEMTVAAIKVLSKNRNGFILLAEGGRIDHAHHENWARLALSETVAFDEAIEAASKLLSAEDTLMIVTADHSHTLSINGYPKRGQTILGPASEENLEGFPYPVLMYGNGPGYKHPRLNPERVNISLKRFRETSAVSVTFAAHNGEDVLAYARGPMAHLFTGLKEQTYIAHMMAFSSCIWQYSNSTHCLQ